MMSKGKYSESNWVKALLRPTSKGVRVQRDREERVKYVLAGYDMKGLSPSRILKYAQLENISIDQIEKRIVHPLAKLKREDEKKYTKEVLKFKRSISGSVLFIILIGVGLLFWLGGKL